MKYLYLFFAVIFFQKNGFSQKQLSHFVYPVDTITSFNNSYSFPENEDAVFLNNYSGAYIIAEGQTSFEPVKIADALIAKEFVFFEKTKKGQGFLVVKDPYGNYHVGGGDIFKPSFFFQISGQVSYKPIFKVVEGNILFTDENKLYSADIEGNIKTLAEMPLIKSFAFDGKNLALINLTSFLYNDAKVDLNKVWQNDHTQIELLLYKSYLYAYNNYNFWVIEKKNSKITNKSITSGLTIVINIRNDSLIVGSAGYVGGWSYHVEGPKYTKISEPSSKLSEIVKNWEGDSLKVNSFCKNVLYAGCVDQYIKLVDLRKSDSTILNIKLTIYSGGSGIKSFISGIKYLGSKDNHYLFLFQSTFGEKRLIIYDRLNFKITSHKIARFLDNKMLIYETNDFNLNQLTFQTTKTQPFSSLPSKAKSFFTQESILFKIGQKNFVYNSSKGSFNLYENFVDNPLSQQFIPGNYEMGANVFLNDTVYNIPTQYKYSTKFYTCYLAKTNTPYYINYQSDSVKFFDLKTQNSFFIYLKEVSTGYLSFIHTDSVLYVYSFGGLYYLKDQKLILIKEGINNTSRLVFRNKLLVNYKQNEKYHLALVDGENFTDLKIFEEQIQGYQIYNNTLYIIQVKGRYWKYDGKEISIIPGFSNDYWNYEINFANKNLYVFVSNNISNGEIYTNLKPNQSIANVPSQIFNPSSIIELGSSLYFPAYVKSLIPITSDNSNTPRFLIKFDIESKKFFYLKSTLLFDVKRLELLDERLRIIGDNYPYNQILIDKDGPSHLTEGFTKIYDSQVKDNRIFVFGSYQNQPPQLYELNSSKPFDYEWVEIKDEPMVSNPEEPTDFGKVIVYPNPVINDFDIKYQNVPGIYHIAIFNEAGQEMYFQHAGDIIDQYEKTYFSSAYLFLEKSPRQNITDIIKAEILSYPPGIYYLTLYFDTYQWKKHSTVRILKVGK
ncbi:MAG: hypothetical protein IPP61_09920 [Cytophagaceae bacterium]|nr:hypothetical protein [Cytophagaceae bacterium]MBL0302657.1 hypothetical protein [Cytophagaceae bacterium]MBL0325481.1 hypothetical protein [Cytophagaceae bacterium]